AILLATIHGLVAAYSSGEESPVGRFRQKVDDVNEYLQGKQLSDDISVKVRDYFNLKYRGKVFTDDIMTILNERLREEIQLHNWRATLLEVPFLNRFEEDEKSEAMLAQVAGAMEECYFVAGDIVFAQGEKGDSMFFIISGEVNVFVDHKKVGSLRNGSYFGEMALMAVIPRTATIMAVTPCKCARLDRENLMKILIDFPGIARQMKTVFMERLAVLQSMK
ncbi:anaphase-promoting complex subunit Hcn1, partial [Dinochytrium kinnereticum]